MFSDDEEEDLKGYILFMEARLFGLSLLDFRKLCYQFASINTKQHPFNNTAKLAGESFVHGFLRRHTSISLRSPEATSAARASGFNRVVVNNFFNLLESLYDKYKFPPSRIYNNDETGIMTVPNKTSKVLSMKGKKQVGTLASAERGTLVTAEICFNALGNYIPPLLIFPRKKENALFEIGTPPETVCVAHPTGWMQSDIFADTWFPHFIKHAKPTAADPVLLIFDGHATHTKNLELIRKARENHVHILVIPPHTSHRLQPLDVSFMGPLNTYYAQAVNTWLRNHPGKVVTIYQTGALFGQAYQRAATSSNAINGFSSTGICPLNPTIFPDRVFAAAETTEKPTPTVDPSSASDVVVQASASSGESLVVEVEVHAPPNSEHTPASEMLGRSASVDRSCVAEVEMHAPPSRFKQQEVHVHKEQLASASFQDHDEANPATQSTFIDMPVVVEAELQAFPSEDLEPSTSKPLTSVENIPVCELEIPTCSSEWPSTVPETPVRSTPEPTYVSPKDIMGVPLVTQDKARRQGSKKGRTVILTSSPYLKELQNESSRSGTKRPTQLFKKGTAKEGVVKHKKRKQGAVEATGNGAEHEDVACIFCSGLFSESRGGEQWIECSKCQQWAHEDCAGEVGTTYTCEYCEE